MPYYYSRYHDSWIELVSSLSGWDIRWRRRRNFLKILFLPDCRSVHKQNVRRGGGAHLFVHLSTYKWLNQFSCFMFSFLFMPKLICIEKIKLQQICLPCTSFRQFVLKEFQVSFLRIFTTLLQVPNWCLIILSSKSPSWIVLASKGQLFFKKLLASTL